MQWLCIHQYNLGFDMQNWKGFKCHFLQVTSNFIVLRNFLYFILSDKWLKHAIYYNNLTVKDTAKSIFTPSKSYKQCIFVTWNSDSHLNLAGFSYGCLLSCLIPAGSKKSSPAPMYCGLTQRALLWQRNFLSRGKYAAGTWSDEKPAKYKHDALWF